MTQSPTARAGENLEQVWKDHLAGEFVDKDVEATLATMTSVTGLAYLVTEGTTLFDLPEGFNSLGQGRVLNVPVPVYVAIVLAVILWALLRFTTTGRKWYAIGGNVEVSRLSGVNVRRGRLLAFAAAGLIAAVGGILLSARLGSASAVQGSDTSQSRYVRDTVYSAAATGILARRSSSRVASFSTASGMPAAGIFCRSSSISLA